MTLQAGARLGPYEITAHIGSGGMGDVYRARDANLQRDVAIKVLPETFAADPDRLARFEREARAVAALSHPGILAIHDFGRSHGVVYAVMELLEGATLRSRLDAGPFPVSPDGSRVWMLGVNGRPYLYSVNGGDPGHVRPIVDTRLQKVDVRIASQRWTLPTGETLKGVRVSGLATVAGLQAGSSTSTCRAIWPVSQRKAGWNRSLVHKSGRVLRSQSTQNDEAEIYLTDRRDLESEQWQLLPTKDEGVMLTGTSH